MKRILTACSVIFILFALLASSPAQAAPAAPDGIVTSTASGGDWTSTSTWNGGVVPGTGDDVVIATTSGNKVTVNANVEVKGVNINSGAILEFSGASTLTINGGYLDNSGTFSAGSGTVAFITTNGHVSAFASTVLNNVSISKGVNFWYGSGSSPAQLTGVLTINSGGYVDTNYPTYGTGAKVNYATGGNFTASNTEWPTDNSLKNVEVSSGTTLIVPIPTGGWDRTLTSLVVGGTMRTKIDTSGGPEATLRFSEDGSVLNVSGTFDFYGDGTKELGNVVITGNTTFSGSSAPKLNDLTITSDSSAADIRVTLNNAPLINGDLTLNKTSNGIVLIQTKLVDGNSIVEFLKLTNNGGVLLNTAAWT